MLRTFLNTMTFGLRGTRATTIGGWTPGLRVLLAGEVLPCGCLVGTYQTVAGEAAAIVDTAAESCPQGHRIDLVLWRHAARGVPPLAAAPQRSPV